MELVKGFDSLGWLLSRPLKWQESFVFFLFVIPFFVLRERLASHTRSAVRERVKGEEWGERLKGGRVRRERLMGVESQRESEGETKEGRYSERGREGEKREESGNGTERGGLGEREEVKK